MDYSFDWTSMAAMWYACISWHSSPCLGSSWEQSLFSIFQTIFELSSYWTVLLIFINTLFITSQHRIWVYIWNLCKSYVSQPSSTELMIYTSKVFMSTLRLVFPMEVWDIFMKFHFLHQFASDKGQMCQSAPTAVQWCKAVTNPASRAKFVATLACWRSAEQEDCIHECKLMPPAAMSFDLKLITHSDLQICYV